MEANPYFQCFCGWESFQNAPPCHATEKDNNKIDSLHEPYVYFAAKGKDYKPYKYGTLVSVVIVEKSPIDINHAFLAQSAQHL